MTLNSTALAGNDPAELIRQKIEPGLSAAGLDDPERFTRDLLDVLYGHDPG